MCWATRDAADLIVKRQREVDGADDEVGESEVRDEDVSSCPHLTRAHHAHEHQQAAAYHSLENTSRLPSVPTMMTTT